MPTKRLSPSWASPPTRRIPDPSTKLAAFQLREETEARPRFAELARLTYARTWTTRNQANLGATGQAVPYPRSRTFTFALQTANGQRTAQSTPLLNGPAIVSGIFIQKTGNPTTRAGWGLFKHTTPINEAFVPVANSPLYTLLFTPMPAVGAVDNDNATDGAWDMQGGNPVNIDPRLRILIPDPTFVVGVYATSEEPGNFDVRGHLTVITDIDSSIVTSLM